MSKTLSSIIAILSLIGMVFGAYFYIDSRYAQADQLRKVEMRLDQKIKSDRLNQLQERIWRIEDRCGDKPTVTEKEELRKLKEDKQRLEMEMQKHK